ncbi:GTP-binding protein, partial [Acinetobacter baumannii]
GSSGLRAEAVPHEETFQRLLYRRAGAFDRVGLERALAGMPASLLRLKGRLGLAGRSETHLLQMVGRRWSLSPLPEPAP